MPSLLRSVTLIVCGACALACTASPDDGPTAIANVSVVSMTSAGVLPGRTVLVDGDRIVAVGPADSLPIPDHATVIEGGGRFLLPGLADMHVHLEHFEDPAILELFVSFGVTTVRNMDGRPRVLEWRREVAAGERLGPRILTAGPILDGDPPLRDDNQVIANADEGRGASSRRGPAPTCSSSTGTREGTSRARARSWASWWLAGGCRARTSKRSAAGPGAGGGGPRLGPVNT